MREVHSLAELLDRLDPRDDDSVRPDVERPLDQGDIQFGDANERDRVAADGRPQMLHDVIPVEMTVFRIDHDPVQAQGHGHFRDACRLQGDP